MSGFVLNVITVKTPGSHIVKNLYACSSIAAALNSTQVSNNNSGTFDVEVASMDASGLESLDMSNMNLDFDESNTLKKSDGFKVRVSGVFRHPHLAKAYIRVFLDLRNCII